MKVTKFHWQAEPCERFLSPTSVPCRSFQLVRPSFKNNSALLSGGALFVSDPTKVTISKCADELSNLRLDEVWKNNLLGEYCLAFDGNAVVGLSQFKQGRYLHLVNIPIPLSNKSLCA